MTAIGRLIHRYAIWIVGVWALAAIIGNNFAPPLEQVITAEDQPFSPAGTATSRAVERSAAAFSQAPGDNIGYLVLERNGVLNDQDRATTMRWSWPYAVIPATSSRWWTGGEPRPSRRSPAATTITR